MKKNLNLKLKLIIAFGGLLTILLVVGLMSVKAVNEFNRVIERIFRENYDSVMAGYKMKEAIEELDRLAEMYIWEQSPDPGNKSESAVLVFEKNLTFQIGNVTLPGEQEANDRLRKLWHDYRQEFETLLALSKDKLAGQKFYKSRIPLYSQKVRQAIQSLIEINLNNIVAVDGQIRRQGAKTRNSLLVLVFCGVLLAGIFIAIVWPAILWPIRGLTRSVREIQKGNLDLVVHVRTHDEIGQLAEAFNEMAASLREFRRTDHARLLRAQHSTQLALNSLSDAVAICNPAGEIELSNDTACRLFGLKAELTLADVGNEKIISLFQRLCLELHPIRPKGYASAIQIFEDGEERFFLPEAVPVFDEQSRFIGATLVLSDVTDMRRIDETKSGLISTVSHELKTPLTSVRLAIHLLVREKLGPLTPKQAEILVAARNDSDRLYRIIENLLDISRIEAGRSEIRLRSVAAEELILQAIDETQTAFFDRGINLTIDIPGDLPPVLADQSRIRHVFANLLDNARKHTPAGGQVRVKARLEGSKVLFSVEDTGPGIPQEHLSHLFERFFRVPGQDNEGHAGLGLAIAREIIEAHGGGIEARSQPGKGAAFTFSLKVDPAFQKNGSKKLSGNGKSKKKKSR